MRTRLASAAVVCALVAFTAGCTSSQPAATPGAEQINLTVATFNEFGYDNLYAEYTKTHPNITITPKKAATSQAARDNMNTRLGAGSGLADIEAVEVDWLPDLLQSADKFVDLASPQVQGRWLDWKTKAATAADGRLLGYGTDIGPEGVCYRSDLFAKAGLPTDREAVAKLLGTTWDDYFAAGRAFTAKSNGVAWFDSAGAVFNARLNQLANPYSSSGTEEKLIPLDKNTQISDLYNSTIKAGVDDKLSARLSQWSQDWTNAFQKNKFATMLCPGWMLGVIEGNSAGVKGWDIANVFPGGGGNWGGSYLTVPAQGKHTEAAKDLAAWLTAPEQQLKAFQAKGTFPSQVEALKSPELLNYKNKFFNNAPTGKILADRAAAVKVTPFKGTHYFSITTLLGDAINRVEVDKTDTATTSWQKAVKEFNALQ